MEYSYVNPEWKKRQKKQKPRVGLAVLLSMVAMATVVGLLGGVLLASNHLSAQQKTAEALSAPTEAPSIAAATEAPAAAETASEPITSAAPVLSAENAVSTPTRFAYDGAYTRAEICEIAAPSVVGIDTVSAVSYWGQTYQATGSGSGVILSADGYIATCAHVVDGATSITVMLSDDTAYPAVLVGSDSRNDIAIIKIDATGLVPAEIGNSDMLTVGEDVIAIGNPLGELRGTATSGIISALRRPVLIDGNVMELVQTDAAISPGNSGGGLFNASGKLIGIVNAKATSSEAEGLGFAIPINDVLGEINDLLQYGYITGQADLGAVTQNVSLRSSYGYWSRITRTCVQVSALTTGGAAEQAGLRIGDLILAVGETEITSNSVLSDVLAAYDPGDVVRLTIQRNGEQFTANVTLAEYRPAA